MAPPQTQQQPPQVVYILGMQALPGGVDANRAWACVNLSLLVIVLVLCAVIVISSSEPQVGGHYDPSLSAWKAGAGGHIPYPEPKGAIETMINILHLRVSPPSFANGTELFATPDQNSREFLDAAALLREEAAKHGIKVELVDPSRYGIGCDRCRARWWLVEYEREPDAPSFLLHTASHALRDRTALFEWMWLEKNGKEALRELLSLQQKK
jgi:hypothetical protein